MPKHELLFIFVVMKNELDYTQNLPQGDHASILYIFYLKINALRTLKCTYLQYCDFGLLRQWAYKH